MAAQVVVQGAARAGAAAGRAGAAAGRAAVNAGKAIGRKAGQAGAQGAKRAGQAGARGAQRTGSAGARGAARAGRTGTAGAHRGARGAQRAGRGAANGRQLGKRGLEGLRGRGRQQPKGGWARQALRDAARGRGGRPATGRGGRRGSGEAEEGLGEVAEASSDVARRWTRNRLRRRRGPFRKTRRWTNRIILVAAAAVLMLPLAMGMYGAQASTTAEQVAAALRCAGAPLDLIAEKTEIPPEALQAYCSAAMEWEVDWAILAAIGKLECDHGRSRDAGCQRPTVNHCGARGPMQFLGNVWRNGTDPVPVGQCPGVEKFTGNPVGPPLDGDGARGWATDGDGDGTADPWAWLDATHAAARKLLHDGVKDDPWGATRAYNGAPEYADRAVQLADGYRHAVVSVMDEAAAAGSGAIGGCGSNVSQASTEPITFPHITPATQSMASSVIRCFGTGGRDIWCYSPRDGQFEHPRGRACDFMMSSGVAVGGERVRGESVATWVMQHAEELHVLYVIWFGRIWWDGDGNIPWSQWGIYHRYGSPTVEHKDHVHVSVHLQPGDPEWARCPGGIACTP